MIVDVYVDVLFVVNLLMDYIVLWFTAVLTKTPRREWRLWLSAALGAAYAVGIFFVPLSFLYGLLAKVAVSALLVWAAFGFGMPKRFLRLLCVFYACTFTLAGVGMALFYFTDVGAKIGAVVSNGVFYMNLPMYLLLLIAGVAYGVLQVAFSYTRRRAARGRRILPLAILRGGRSVQVRALVDTGNLLTEPKTGWGVVLVEWERLRPLFPDGMGGPGDGFALIPYTTIAEGEGAVVGFVPDGLILAEKKPVPLTGLYVGILNKTLDKLGEYHAILPALPEEEHLDVHTQSSAVAS